MNININIDQINAPYKQATKESKEPSFHFSWEEKAPLVENYEVFKGTSQNPFLAPRGVFSVGQKLIVSDTGQNRVFIWNTFPETVNQAPDVVLGQMEQSDTGRNSGSAISASTLHYPSGVWSDGEKLMVADAWNHRVLIWHTFPSQNGQPADVVLGQPTFEQNEVNINGIGSTPSAKSLNWPYGLFSDGKSMWIADTGNRRILFFENIPTESYSAADKLIGKSNFADRDYENNDPIWPYSVKVDTNGALIVSDTQFYRTLVWKNNETAFSQKADLILGQADFEAAGQNQFSLFPKQNSLNWTYDACFYKEGILVADTGNSRILFFDKIPSENAAEADNLIGHKSFNIGSENSETRYGTEKQLYWPFSICVNDGVLWVADTGNHRILKFNLS